MQSPLFPDRRPLPDREAHLSGCGRYRYRLWRAWGEGRELVCWVMLNPSTADAEVDDPTLRRCTEFSKRWGYDGLVVVNLHPFRSPDPRDLVDDLSEEERQRNLDIVLKTAKRASRVVVAWGNHGQMWGSHELAMQLARHGHRLWCLGTTKSGAPKHPLARGKHRVPEDFELERWTTYFDEVDFYWLPCPDCADLEDPDPARHPVFGTRLGAGCSRCEHTGIVRSS